MSRTYLRAAGLTAVGLLAAGLSQEGSARALFDSAAVAKTMERAFASGLSHPAHR